jgi:transcriptional regulator with XRE-family HTH domain
MNAKEIKEKRKKLGYTQKKLAELIGVSTQTINGYENGKEIPSTKNQILDKVLNGEIPNIINETPTNYQISSGYEKKISNLKDQIKAREEIILLTNDKSIISHQKEMIKLLSIQISIIEDAKKEE